MASNLKLVLCKKKKRENEDERDEHGEERQRKRMKVCDDDDEWSICRFPISPLRDYGTKETTKDLFPPPFVLCTPPARPVSDFDPLEEEYDDGEECDGIDSDLRDDIDEVSRRLADYKPLLREDLDKTLRGSACSCTINKFPSSFVAFQYRMSFFCART